MDSFIMCGILVTIAIVLSILTILFVDIGLIVVEGKQNRERNDLEQMAYLSTLNRKKEE